LVSSPAVGLLARASLPATPITLPVCRSSSRREPTHELAARICRLDPSRRVENLAHAIGWAAR